MFIVLSVCLSVLQDLERGFIESALESLREREEEEIKRRMDAMAQVKEMANTLRYEGK